MIQYFRELLATLKRIEEIEQRNNDLLKRLDSCIVTGFSGNRCINIKQHNH